MSENMSDYGNKVMFVWKLSSWICRHPAMPVGLVLLLLRMLLLCEVFDNCMPTALNHCAVSLQKPPQDHPLATLSPYPLKTVAGFGNRELDQIKNYTLD